MLTDDNGSQQLLFFFPIITIAVVYKLNFLFFFTPISKMQIPIKARDRSEEKGRYAWECLMLRSGARPTQELLLNGESLGAGHHHNGGQGFFWI